MRRAALALGASGLLALTGAVPARAGTCGSIRVFGEPFSLSAGGGTSCRTARHLITRYQPIARAIGCGAYVTGGPCRIDGYSCAASSAGRITCIRGRHTVVARPRRTG